jgi:site-specific DNA-methyltransferase (adenine-specific)
MIGRATKIKRRKSRNSRATFRYQTLISRSGRHLKPYYTSPSGALFAADCMDLLRHLRSGVVDTVFADPPFNLGKEYGDNTNDRREGQEYITWCHSWLYECVRVLKSGGALFLYNLPKWNVLLASYLAGQGMDFRHWIAIEANSRLPIPGRLYPSHYSLLYYTKGKPKTFHRIRTPIQLCRHCGHEIKDYGGHRDSMNPDGVTLKDIWTDIPTVRHWKFKSRSRRCNALSTKLLERVIGMSTVTGDLVLDPFAGSGTTFAVCEARGRRWIGTEIDFSPEIRERLEETTICFHRNSDHVRNVAIPT